MIMRAWAPMLTVALCFAVQGCGDDDSGGDGDGNAGSGGRNSGTSGSGTRAGSGAGNAGSGSGSPSIAECMLDEMMTGGSTAGCDGIEEYGECVQDECLSDCTSQCEDYFDCVQDADDPCNPTGCQMSSQCTNCFAGSASCFLDCIGLVMCGETTPGGACDQLDDCCAAQSDQMRASCEQLAMLTRSGGGDEACMDLMGLYCM